jgi:hypothetical protein
MCRVECLMGYEGMEGKKEWLFSAMAPRWGVASLRTLFGIGICWACIGNEGLTPIFGSCDLFDDDVIV